MNFSIKCMICNNLLSLHLPLLRSEDFEKEVLDDTKWIDDFTTQSQEDELSKTAKEFSESVDDPKLANSEVCMRLSVIRCGQILC